jgi:hypothetical protein
MPEKVKKHTHHTPRVYLRRFADSNDMLMAERPGRQAAKPIPVPEVGVKKRFYAVELSDGTRSNAVEDSLGLIEGKVKHAFREIDNEALPLDVPTKVILAEFLGQQMARGLTYRELHAAGISQGEAWLRSRVREIYLSRRPEFDDPPADLEAAADEYARNYDLSALDAQNVVVIDSLQTGVVLANALANMCWSFVSFPKSMLLSSDQPVVCWLGPHKSSPWWPEPANELRVPLSPTVALVASWHDQDDTPHFLDGTCLTAMSINYHTAKQAADWVYWMPGTNPRRDLPLNDEPITGPRVEESRRRELTGEMVRDRIIEKREDVIVVFTRK